VRRTVGEVPYSQLSIVPNASSPRWATRARARHVVEQPLELGARESRVDDEPGLARDQLGLALRTQIVAERRGAPVLPNDRRRHRAARGALPQHRGLALVRDADGRDIARLDDGARQRFVQHAGLRRPDLRGIVLDPPGPSESAA
jgi:hypothetical protein